MAESEEELKRLLMKVKEESEEVVYTNNQILLSVKGPGFNWSSLSFF